MYAHCRKHTAKRKQSLFDRYTHAILLTFAGLHAFRPPVMNVSVASTSAVLVPSTTGSAATDSAGFLERAARWARDPISNRCWGDGWRGNCGYGYELSFRVWPT